MGWWKREQASDLQPLDMSQNQAALSWEEITQVGGCNCLLGKCISLHNLIWFILNPKYITRWVINLIQCDCSCPSASCVPALLVGFKSSGNNCREQYTRFSGAIIWYIMKNPTLLWGTLDVRIGHLLQFFPQHERFRGHVLCIRAWKCTFLKN